MKKIDCILLFIDNYLYLRILKNKKDYELRYDNYLFQGRIIKPNIVSKKIHEVLKNEKALHVLTPLNCLVVYNPHLKYIDKKILIDALENCGFRDIKLYSTKELIPKAKCFLEINNNYLIKYLNHKYEFIQLNKYVSISDIINNIDDEVFLVGINKNIEEIATKTNNAYYYLEPEKYYLNRVMKKV